MGENGSNPLLALQGGATLIIKPKLFFSFFHILFLIITKFVVKAWLLDIEAANLPPLESLSPPEARKAYEAPQTSVKVDLSGIAYATFELLRKSTRDEPHGGQKTYIQCLSEFEFKCWQGVFRGF